MLRVEARIGRPLEGYLADEYESKTTSQIAVDLGISPEAVARWMRSLGIELRFSGQRPPKAAA